MANPILVTGAAGRVGAVGRTVTELLLKQGKAVRAMVRNEDERRGAGVARHGTMFEGLFQPTHTPYSCPDHWHETSGNSDKDFPRK